jgi:hypothetical protein
VILDRSSVLPAKRRERVLRLPAQRKDFNMPTFYEELLARGKKAEEGFRKYENDCVVLSHDVEQFVRDEIGCGEVCRRVTFEPIPTGGTKAPGGGYVDDQGRYIFALRIPIGRHYLDFCWAIYRNDAGQWVLSGPEKQPTEVRVITMVNGRADVPGLIDHVKEGLNMTLSNGVHEKRWA